MLGALLILLVVTVPVAAFAWRRDPSTLGRAAIFTRVEFLRIAVRLPFALTAAACIAELVPERTIAAVLGPETGLAGIAAASVLGGLLPGGPIVSFPIAILFAHQGAGGPQVIAMITGWSVYAFHRVISFESPIMGWPFVGLRLAASWFVPPLAGIFAGVLAAAFGLAINIR
ncbi:MAG: hypothetical protein KJZ80_12090 [Hyphomicrobiaceae bacterium]|nr:hypothetical protein [Hyphomicrobiaceae bacterium]